MKKKIFLTALSALALLSLASCDQAVELTNASGSKVKVVETSDSTEVANVIETLTSVEAISTDITTYYEKGSVSLNLDAKINETSYIKTNLEAAAELYLAKTDFTSSNIILNHYSKETLNGSVDLNVPLDEENTLSFKKDDLAVSLETYSPSNEKKVYLSYSGLDLGSYNEGLGVAKEGKYYTTYDNISVGDESSIGSLLPTDYTQAKQALTEFYNAVEKVYSLKDLCEKFGITISSVKNDVIEFKANVNLANVIDVLNNNTYITTNYAMIKFILAAYKDCFKDASIDVTVGVNIKTLTLTSLSLKTNGLAEAINNVVSFGLSAGESDDDTLKNFKVNTLDFSVAFNVELNKTIPSFDTTGFTLLDQEQE